MNASKSQGNKYVGLFFTIIVIIFSIHIDQTHASVIPGTMKKGTHTVTGKCKETPHTYKPTSLGGYCDTSVCLQEGTYTCPAGDAVAPGPDGKGGRPDSMTGYCGCARTNNDPVINPTGQFVYNDFTFADGAPMFGSSGLETVIGLDSPESCNWWADGTLHTPSSSSYQQQVCGSGNLGANIFSGGANGMCNKFGSRDNLVTFHDQLGAITRQRTPEEFNPTCVVQGRYATTDNGGPAIVASGLGVFDGGEQNSWCNLTKYRKGEVLPGCQYYSNKAGVSYGGDLLNGLGVTVSDYDSGVLSVSVSIGKCTGTWDHTSVLGSRIDSLDMPNILVSTIAPAGVRTEFKTLSVGYSDLLSTFGVSRLDDCLGEGKNYLTITALDQARSDYDGVSLSSNISTTDYRGSNGYIKIDNYSPKLGLGADMATLADSNTPASCFVGGATIAAAGTDWKNYTLDGTIRSTDPFGADAADCSPTIPTPPSGGASACGASPGTCDNGYPININTYPAGADWTCKDVLISGTLHSVPCAYFKPASCGSADGTPSAAAPTTGLCGAGSTSGPISGTGPWSWTCTGRVDSVTCNAPKDSTVNCGVANGTNLASMPTTGLCNSSSTASAVTGTGPWNWTCSAGGTSVYCSAFKDTVGNPGACGLANGIFTPSAPTTNLCRSGTPTHALSDGTGGWYWVCEGSSGGAPASCSTPPSTPPSCTSYAPGIEFNLPESDGISRFVMGGAGGLSCGPTNCNTDAGIAANMYLWRNPVSGTGFPTECRACPAGETRNTTGDGCIGSGPGVVNGSCGPATTLTTDTSPDSDILCSTGTPTAVTAYEDIHSPDLWTNRWKWSCTGSNGGATVDCSSKRLVPGPAKTCERVEIQSCYVPLVPRCTGFGDGMDCTYECPAGNEGVVKTGNTMGGAEEVRSIGPRNPIHSFLYATSATYDNRSYGFAESVRAVFCTPGMTQTEINTAYQSLVDTYGGDMEVLHGSRRHFAAGYTNGPFHRGTDESTFDGSFGAEGYIGGDLCRMAGLGGTGDWRERLRITSYSFNGSGLSVYCGMSRMGGSGGRY